MGIKELINDAIDLAKVAGNVLPGVSGGAAIAEKILDMVTSLKAVAEEPADENNLEAAHAELFKKVTDKGHKLSLRLRG